MAIVDEVAHLDATAQAELVRKGEVQPLELVEAAIERCERVNPKINAVIHPMYEEAKKIASGNLPDGPFKGVPFVLKDLLAQYAGVPMSLGSNLYKNFVPKVDSDLVRRYKEAGLICIGKTNTPEFGLQPTTEPERFGPTRNPWDLDRTPGGSSGGSSAAVAAGIVPVAHGNDGGGSIRIPAACCGLFGLKPNRARISLGPELGERSGGLVNEHVLTHSVRDSAAILDATDGPDLGAPYWAPPKQRPYIEEVGADPGSLRIAFTSKTLFGEPVHAENVAAVEDTAKLLEELGHKIEERDFDFAIEPKQLNRASFTVFSVGCAESIESAKKDLGRDVAEADVEPLTWGVYQMVKARSITDYLSAWRTLFKASRKLDADMQTIDVWLTSTLGEPPVELGILGPEPDNALAGLFRAGQFVPLTPIANWSGHPAMSVPLAQHANGLPLGLQFYGRFGDEATLFRLAAQLEQARPWKDRRAPVHA
jgi:amidase